MVRGGSYTTTHTTTRSPLSLVAAVWSLWAKFVTSGQYKSPNLFIICIYVFIPNCFCIGLEAKFATSGQDGCLAAG